MNFDWSEYYNLAKGLAGWPNVPNAPDSQEEAKLRSSISRAYFAAFCQARNHLIERGIDIPENVDSHRIVSDEFANRTDRMSKDIALQLGKLRVSRNRADYWDHVRRLPEAAKEALKGSRSVLDQLDKLP